MGKQQPERASWWARGPGRLVRLRPKLLIAAVVLMAAGMGARRVWDHVQSQLAASPRYQVTAETIHIAPDPAPPWIRGDVKAEVLRDSNFVSNLSLLDPPAEIHRRLVDAFELHPWIRAVPQVEIVGPRRIKVTLDYREPVAVVQVATGGATDLLPVDAEGYHLPDGDLSEVEKSYLPRIADIEGRPLVGEPWTDTRVLGAIQLADRLRTVWDRFRLLEIVPSAYPEVQRSQRFYVYEIRTSGGTIIRWGAAPQLGPPGESTFEEKFARLAEYIRQHGPLDSINTPQVIDVRTRLTTEKRTVKNDGSELSGQEVVR